MSHVFINKKNQFLFTTITEVKLTMYDYNPNLFNI